MNITFQQAKYLIESGVNYVVSCRRSDVRTFSDVIKLRESGCYEDIIFDYYKEEGYEEHEGEWITTKPACIEILVALDTALTWEEMSQILIG